MNHDSFFLGSQTQQQQNKPDEFASDKFPTTRNKPSKYIEANPWLCNCDTRDFLNFIQGKRSSNYKLHNVKCNGKDLSIYEMTLEQFCPKVATWIVTVCLSIPFGLLIVIVAIYYRYQQAIKVWLFANRFFRQFVTKVKLEHDKVFDVLAWYCSKDAEFVENNILKKLEQGPRPYKLCVPSRDWLAVDWITSHISKSVEKSRQTIVIISQNFIQSTWGMMGFRLARAISLKEGRARVLVIVYGEIGEMKILEPELRAYIALNTNFKLGD